MAEPKTTKIACIGWGSLVWNPGTLPCRDIWHEDGPELPVEFARQSDSGNMTLVLCDGVQRMRACWVMLDVPDMQSAKERLGKREYEKASARWIAENIGYWTPSGDPYGREAATIAAWANSRGLDAVVWTNLPCKFDGKPNVMPRDEDVLAYLRGLSGGLRVAAEEYLRKTPAQIDTNYRRLIAAELGWIHEPCDIPACRCKAFA